MRPVWQLATITTQVGYLEAQKKQLTYLFHQIDKVIYDAQVWIDEDGKNTKSFSEMCKDIESTFGEISSKCLHINVEPQHNVSGSEAVVKPSDPPRLEESYLKTKLDLFETDLKAFKTNDVENACKLESIIKKMFASFEVISDLQSQLNLLQTSLTETRAVLKELMLFATPLKCEVEFVSKQLEKTESNLQTLVDKFKAECSSTREKFINSHDQFGLIWQLLKGKMIPFQHNVKSTKSTRGELIPAVIPVALPQRVPEIIEDILKVKQRRASCKVESHKEYSTDSSRIKGDKSCLSDGTYETEVAERGEAELREHFIRCKKNPGHTQFVPVNDFNTKHLPKDHHDQELVEYIKAVANLTVRLAVTKTSAERPEFWPNTDKPYPFYDVRRSNVMRVGTGMVKAVNETFSNGVCPCFKCQQSGSPSKLWGEVWLFTATQVVFDDLEARHTICRLFFDKPDCPMVTLSCWMVSEADIIEDWCLLKCVTCDVVLLDKLIKMLKWNDVWKKIVKKYERTRDMDKITLMVSHPHGGPKQVSVGHWIDRYAVDEQGGTKYTYTTCTCPGSSGACVQLLGYSSLHLHSGVNSEGINFSGIGWD